MSTPQPDWVQDDWPNYHDMVRSWGYTVVAHQDFGSYQGDEAYLLQDISGSYGLLVFGYGSCSGCDALEGVMSDVGYGSDGRDWTPLVRFSQELRDDVHWEADKEALAAWVMAQPENQWWSFDQEIARWINDQLGTTLPIVEY